ncbi:MAG: tetratricopeptide repeat protein [Planctomycetia bacterium]|nr:tetratricopeptide repeat protein [Planctomycetia bacterium]
MTLRFRWAWLCGAMFLTGCATNGGNLLSAHTRAEQDYHQGNLVGARKKYRLLVQAVPGNPLFWSRLGNCNALLNHPHQAADDYEHALTLNPQLATVRYNLAILHIKEARAQLITATTGTGLPPAVSAEITRLLIALPRVQTPTAPTISQS